MNPTPQIKVLSSHFVATGMVAWIAITMSAPAAGVIAATADNDLVTVLKASGVTAERFDSPEVAVAKARQAMGAGSRRCLSRKGHAASSGAFQEGPREEAPPLCGVSFVPSEPENRQAANA
ncbi:MAG: hypothetical protein OSA93_13990 [Akkermansiaceae bacterium]|nr:hypothetical protein [Akkermansiaceae bacterium]